MPYLDRWSWTAGICSTVFSFAISGFVANGEQPVAGPQASVKAQAKSKATLPPRRVMEVLEYEVGVEVGSRAFFAKSAYDGDLKAAQAVVKTIVPNLDRRYLHSTGIKFKLGKVIIHTKADEDPLRDLVLTTGGGGTAPSSLHAFRDYWNKHPEIVGTSHDLACYHVMYPPSGLAYVKSVGTSQRYATVGGRGQTSWADGTLTHEFGHSWGLLHTNASGFFYESSPRVKGGATTAGGSSNPISIMVGDRRNIGRLASDEAMKVMATRKERRSHGSVVDPGPVKPFGMRDKVVLGDTSTVIDVIDNDYDVNNDVLDVKLLDTVSHQGGRISLSESTGPGGRNEIRYQLPKSGLPNADDFFHYTVFDTTGKSDFGAVYIQSSDLIVDLQAEQYQYDFGTKTSPVEPGYTRISPETSGDVTWKGKVNAADRGRSNGVNKINQDLVFSKDARRLRHLIANGVWRVTLNMGDQDFSHDQMGVRAEGRLITNRVDSAKGQFVYVSDDGGSTSAVTFDVKVTDKRLDLTFFDRGGSDPNWVATRMSLQKMSDL